MSNGNTSGGVVSPYRFEPWASDSDKDGDNGSVREDKMPVACSQRIGACCFSVQLTVYKGFCIY